MRLTVLLGLALALPLLAGCGSEGGSDGGSEGASEPTESGAASQEAAEKAAAELEAGAPKGKYAAAYVLESSNVPGAEDGFESTSTYAFAFEDCTETECTGTVAAPAKGSYTWDGEHLVVIFDEIEKKDTCTGDDGQKMKGSTFRSSTEHEAHLTSDVPGRLIGHYEQMTVFSDLGKGCDPAGPDRQHAEFSLTLERK